MISRTMRAMDAAFLHIETARAPMHTMQVLVFSGAPVSLERLQRAAEQWVDRLPIMRCKVKGTSWGVRQPRLVNDEAFNLREHLRQVHLVGSEPRRALQNVVSRIASRPLERERALWEATLVTGLEAGTWALVLKLHHALADGQAKANLLRAILSGAPGPEPEVSALPWGRSMLSAMLLLPRLLLATLLGWRAVAKHRRAHSMAPARVFDTERHAFNHPVSARRTLLTTDMPLARLRAVKSAADVTLNDAVLALVSGALRRYLVRRGEAPGKALVASVPVALESDTARWEGNRVSSLFASLPVHLGDAQARLRHVSTRMQAAKHEQRLRRMDADGWMRVLPPVLLRAVTVVMDWTDLTRLAPPPINLIVSNVRGPEEALQVGGQRLQAVYSVGPLLRTAGLNITVWSYDGNMGFAILGCPDLNPDLASLVDDLHTELGELERGLQGTATRMSNAG